MSSGQNLTLFSSLFLIYLSQSPSANPWKDPALDKLALFCKESRSVYDWVPSITLPERWTYNTHNPLMVKAKSRSWSSTRRGFLIFLPHFLRDLRGCGCKPSPARVCNPYISVWVGTLVLDYPVEEVKHRRSAVDQVHMECTESDGKSLDWAGKDMWRPRDCFQ